MELTELIQQLEEIRRTQGSNIEVFFDTKAADYNCHMVNVDGVDFVDTGEAFMVCISTNQEKNRSHCNHKIFKFINEKVTLIICVKCGKIFEEGTAEDLKKIYEGV